MTIVLSFIHRFDVRMWMGQILLPRCSRRGRTLSLTPRHRLLPNLVMPCSATIIHVLVAVYHIRSGPRFACLNSVASPRTRTRVQSNTAFICASPLTRTRIQPNRYSLLCGVQLCLLDFSSILHVIVHRLITQPAPSILISCVRGNIYHQACPLFSQAWMMRSGLQVGPRNLKHRLLSTRLRYHLEQGGVHQQRHNNFLHVCHYRRAMVLARALATPLARASIVQATHQSSSKSGLPTLAKNA